MAEYKVPTKFIFAGTFSVTADSLEQAVEYVDKHCGLVLGGDIHSSLPDEAIDWDFLSHPEKVIDIDDTREVGGD